MESDNKQIIEMEASSSDEGEIFYAQKKTLTAASKPKGLITKIFGIVLGITFFLLMLAFMFYIVFPLVIIIALWFWMRRVFGTRRKRAQ